MERIFAGSNFIEDKRIREGSSGEAMDQEAGALLNASVDEKTSRHLGEIVTRGDIKSSIGPFHVLPEYRTQYPEAVTRALGGLYAEYNSAFRPLVDANREWDTDYQYCLNPDGTPLNGWVQIDMVGLPDRFLDRADALGEEAVRETLRGRIFEIENSLAMYQLLENLFSGGQQETLFKRQFRASLDDLRQKHGKPIALLAVTDQKYQAMRESEFGKSAGETLTDEEVKDLSGFDRFFGPEEFQQYLNENGGECDYLLYARTSDPVSKLKRPASVVEIPLLEDDNFRRIIKANAITFNVDSPAWPTGDPRRINDTKEYLPLMSMGFQIRDYDEILSEGFLRFAESQGVRPSDVTGGIAVLRAKPIKGTYGCYGHETGTVRDRKFRQGVRKGIKERGLYVVQPEMKTPKIVNETNGVEYVFIDRNFFSTDGHGDFRFMGGFRSLMPTDTVEAARGRNHGSQYTVWSEIS